MFSFEFLIIRNRYFNNILIQNLEFNIKNSKRGGGQMIGRLEGEKVGKGERAESSRLNAEFLIKRHNNSTFIPYILKLM
jgi:hypothetical protein